MLTKKTRYALKALMVLAERDPAQPTLIAELSERENIPKKFLEAILRELKQHGMLDAQRWRGGGYSLRSRPEELTMAAVIRADLVENERDARRKHRYLRSLLALRRY